MFSIVLKVCCVFTLKSPHRGDSNEFTQYTIFSRKETFFTQDSKVEDLFCGAPSSSEPSLFFSNYLFSLGLKPIQDDFQHDFARMTEEADEYS